MADSTPSNQNIPDDVAQNTGARNAAIDRDPSISLKEGENAAAGKGPNAAGGPAPSSAEAHVKSTSDPEATDLPTANAPNPEAADSES